MPGAGRRSASRATSSHGATIVGTGKQATPGDAAFANATLGHGLVREDMHAGQHLPPRRGDLADPAGAVGTHAIFRRHTPVPPRSSAMKPAHRSAARCSTPTSPGSTGRPGWWRRSAPRWPEVMRSALSENAATSAIAIAANTSSGLNEWPHAGGSEMYFHPGFAARNAIAAIELAEAGAFASETILEGEAGLFAAFRRQPLPPRSRLFAGDQPEIMAVYNKPAPACNFAQTAAQAALRVAREIAAPDEIAAISIRVPEAAARYPGCDSRARSRTRCRPR